MGRQAPVTGKLKVLEGKGKYLIPGLWDMHIHPDDPELVPLNPKPEHRDLLLPLFVLNGVTTVRDMGGDLGVIKDWKKRIADGKLLGPRFFAGGPLVDGPKPMWPASIAVSTPEEGRAAVRKLKAEGADFIKVYSLIPREPFYAIADEAKKQQIPFEGHKPDALTNLEASASGMASIEHMLGFPREFADPAKMQKLRESLPADMDRVERRVKTVEGLIAAHDPGREQEVYQAYVKNANWHCPTLTVSFANAHYEDWMPKQANQLKYLPKYLRGWWTPEQNVHLQNRNAKALEADKKLVEHLLTYVRNMHKAGVKLMTGTDMGGNPLCFAGFSMATELELFVRAGISPMDALICATSNPATFMGRQKELGTVEAGKIADLVLLEGDPLADIGNVRKISAVIQGKNAWDKAELKKELDKLEAAAAKT